MRIMERFISIAFFGSPSTPKAFFTGLLTPCDTLLLSVNVSFINFQKLFCKGIFPRDLEIATSR